MSKRDFEYDPFQKEAMAHIDKDHSLVVSAPTGAGKTVIAEYVIDKCMGDGQGAIYTAPIKALSNQKYRDFSERYGADKVGIVTGDLSINPYAPILIMTTEIFRNALFDEKERFQEQSWVIYDEIHYIDDLERGTVWEESLMFFPKHMRMLCLSATIPNLDELTEWIQKIHAYPIEKVLEEKRPTPLVHMFQCKNYIGSSFGSLRKAYDQAHKNRHMDKFGSVSPLPLIQDLKDKQRLPAIYFVFARKRAEELAQACLSFQFLTEEEQVEIKELFGSYLKRYNIEQEKSVLKMLPLLERGIAFHHAGMLPSLKDAIECLFSSRLVKMIFTTETFALGINMPARTVIFDELRKFYGIRFENLRTRDYYQMAGRAGRRSLDDEGYVYSRIDPFRIRFNAVKKIIKSSPEPVLSQFNTSYATLMHLYAKFGEELYDIYLSSFHFHQANRRERKGGRQDLQEKIYMLENLDYLREGKLMDKGKFAANMYGYELMLGEMYADGFLEKLAPVDLNIVLGSLVFEPRKRQVSPSLSKHMKDLRRQVRHYSRKIHKEENRFDIFPVTEQGYFHISPILEAWSCGESFDCLQEYGEVAEGEIVRNIRMVIQLLRLLINSGFMTPEFVKKAKKCLDMINRGAVDAERQLRIETEQ